MTTTELPDRGRGRRFRSGSPAQLLPATLAVALMMAGCSSSTGAAPDAKREGTNEEIPTLTWAVTAAPRSLDPAHAFDTSSVAATTEILDPVIGLDADGNLVPRLAESWDQVDPTTLVLKLRDGVTFWDGSPLTAEDVAWSLRRHLDPEVASEMSYYFEFVDSIEATGPSEVTIRLTQADPRFIYTLQYALVMEKKYSLATKDLGGPKGLVMGTGAFEPESFSSATGVTMTRNDDYWGEKPKAQRLEIKVIPDSETLRLAIQSGDVDGTFQLPIEKAASWDKMSDVGITYAPGMVTTMLTLDVSKPPFDDVHARRAVAYAVDRQGISDALFAGHADPAAQSIVDPALFSNSASEQEVDAKYADLPSYSFDMDKAADELAQSATPDGFEVEVEYPDARPYLGQMLQTVAQNLDGIGIHLEVKEVPSATWIGNLRQPKGPTMGIVPLGADYPSPASLLKAVLAPPTEASNGNYATYYPDDLVAEMDTYRTGTPEQQNSSLSTVMARMGEDVPYVPMTYQPAAVALNGKFAYVGDFSGWTLYGSEWAHNVAVAAD